MREKHPDQPFGTKKLFSVAPLKAFESIAPDHTAHTSDIFENNGNRNAHLNEDTHLFRFIFSFCTSADN